MQTSRPNDTLLNKHKSLVVSRLKTPNINRGDRKEILESRLGVGTETKLYDNRKQTFSKILGFGSSPSVFDMFPMFPKFTCYCFPVWPVFCIEPICINRKWHDTIRTPIWSESFLAHGTNSVVRAPCKTCPMHLIYDVHNLAKHGK